ncbi:hypothetical protein E2320_002325 [Naja naja]|nr:hypothetical protein E2320_002325 [Naja naja]
MSKAEEKDAQWCQKVLEKQLEREADKHRELAFPAAAGPPSHPFSAPLLDLSSSNRGAWSPGGAAEPSLHQAPLTTVNSESCVNPMIPLLPAAELREQQAKRPRLAPEATFTPNCGGDPPRKIPPSRHVPIYGILDFGGN